MCQFWISEIHTSRDGRAGSLLEMSRPRGAARVSFEGRIRREGECSVSRPWFEEAAIVAPTVSPGPESEDDLLDAAFELAHFIHADRQIARAICFEAMQRLEIAAAAQIKRLYYRPLRQGRFRASWGDRHLLQRLVYFQSEPWERLSESRDPESLTEEDLLLRFLKHLCQITMKRNSFYASIALGRIVHAYSTADTMGLYHAIAPEGCERKQSDYLRSRKAQLLDEVRTRFGDLLSIVRGPHQEDRIETREPAAEKAAWVRECLRVLTPWAVPCWGQKEKASGGRRRNRFAPERDEDSLEARRFHALFDPPCFAAVTRVARLADPASRLAIPRFQVGGRPPAQGGRGGEDRSTRLTPEERAEIQRRLSEEARRRRDAPTRFLRVLVDGQERARIDPRASTIARLSLEETAEMIEVRVAAPGGEIPLALHALTGAPEGQPEQAQVFSIALESGQSLSFRVEPAAGSPRAVEIDYRETSAPRAALLAARRAAWRIGEAARMAAGWAQQPVTLLLLLGAIGLSLYLSRTPADQTPATRGAAAAPVSEPSLETAPIAHPAPSSSRDVRPAADSVAVAKPKPDRPFTRVPRTAPRLPLSAPLPETSLARAPLPAPNPPHSEPATPLFSLERTTLLDKPPAEFSASTDRTLQVSAETPLDAVRNSFVNGLTADRPESSSHGIERSGSPALSARASAAPRSAPAIRDLRAAAFEAAVSTSKAVTGMPPRLLPSRPDNSSRRIPIIRQVSAPRLADTNCRQPEPVCGLPQIGPAAARPYPDKPKDKD